MRGQAQHDVETECDHKEEVEEELCKEETTEPVPLDLHPGLHHRVR